MRFINPKDKTWIDNIITHSQLTLIISRYLPEKRKIRINVLERVLGSEVVTKREENRETTVNLSPSEVKLFNHATYQKVWKYGGKVT